MRHTTTLRAVIAGTASAMGMTQKHQIVVVERETKQGTPQSYNAPELFAVGQTVDLIQGGQWRGPLDHSNSWPIWPLE